MFVFINPNPKSKLTGDCTIRAISLANNISWDAAYLGLCAEGYELKDMPSNNGVWGQYLREHGWKRHALPDICPECYTVAEFAADKNVGTYVIACASHVVCVKDGDWLDSWDSGDETAIYYFDREE